MVMCHAKEYRAKLSKINKITNIRIMKKYTITNIDKLRVGDTFVKDGDVNDIVFTVMELKCSIKGKYYARKGELRMPDIVDINEPLIFLKHGNN